MARCSEFSVTVTPGQSASRSSSFETTDRVTDQIGEEVENARLKRHFAPTDPDNAAGLVDLERAEFERHCANLQRQERGSAQVQRMLRRP